MTISATILESPKTLLDRDIAISVGDIVTTDDNLPTVRAYVVKSINEDNEATVCYLELNEAKDDIIIRESTYLLNYLLYLGESFINVGGILDNVRNQIVNDLKDK